MADKAPNRRAKSLRLRAGETVATGIERIVAAELAEARAILLDPSSDPDTAVHEARKALKRARAALKLVRAPLGPRYRELNRAWRDLSRRLAPQRDAATALVTLENLIERSDGRVSLRTHAAGRRRLTGLRREAPDARSEVAAALDAPPLASDIGEGDGEILASGLRRSYARGRAAMRGAIEAPSAAAFHAWRKRVKDLWHQIQLLSPAFPALFHPTARSLHRLSEVLGEVHDLDELEHALESRGKSRAVGRAPAALRGLIDEARTEGRRKALRLGARLYAERPNAFARRFQAYWSAWRDEVPIEGPASRPIGSRARRRPSRALSGPARYRSGA